MATYRSGVMTDLPLVYPEHDKLMKVADESQQLGHFLDFGLPQMNLHLYETKTVDCECYGCEREYWHRSDAYGSHSNEEIAQALAEDRAVQLEVTIPTHRTIQSILAEYFEIDQTKLDAEKEAMLSAIREANAA
jgi:hypothetical protein